MARQREACPTQCAHLLPDGQLLWTDYNQTIDFIALERVWSSFPTVACILPGVLYVALGGSEDDAAATSRAWSTARGRRCTVLVPCDAWSAVTTRKSLPFAVLLQFVTSMEDVIRRRQVA